MTRFYDMDKQVFQRAYAAAEQSIKDWVDLERVGWEGDGQKMVVETAEAVMKAVFDDMVKIGRDSAEVDIKRLKEGVLMMASTPFLVNITHPYAPHPLSAGSLEEMGLIDLFEDDMPRLIEIAKRDKEIVAERKPSWS